MEDSRKKIKNILKINKLGMSITDLTKKSDYSRSKVRTLIAFLLGSYEIVERRIGMAKVYTLNNNK